jgi:hypothetical protein
MQVGFRQRLQGGVQSGSGIVIAGGVFAERTFPESGIPDSAGIGRQGTLATGGVVGTRGVFRESL